MNPILLASSLAFAAVVVPSATAQPMDPADCLVNVGGQALQLVCEGQQWCDNGGICGQETCLVAGTVINDNVCVLSPPDNPPANPDNCAVFVGKGAYVCQPGEPDCEITESDRRLVCVNP